MAIASPTSTDAAGSIGLDLERVRLEHRARRLGFAITALRRLRATDGPAPAPLHQVIAGFSQELADADRRLAEL